MDHEYLQKEFDRLAPWKSGFIIDGRHYGGAYVPAGAVVGRAQARGDHEDYRLVDFKESYKDCKSVLELGSLEGAHSISLAGSGYDVVAIEGRDYNVKKAELVKSLMCPEKNIKFLCENLENFDLTSLGIFDVVFCVGLLYHLPNPWVLLEQISKVTDRMFINTHFCHDHEAVDQHWLTEYGYAGKIYKEYGFGDPLSGLSHISFWPKISELHRMLEELGFSIDDSRVTPIEGKTHVTIKATKH